MRGYRGRERSGVMLMTRCIGEGSLPVIYLFVFSMGSSFRPLWAHSELSTMIRIVHFIELVIHTKNYVDRT